ncbi:MAG: hypothetical protein D6704_03825 [Nitrospirae bacterium]|nr:MAG: hypothetical protein D6704_03825 [Nitrospirota bacterium]
MTTDPDAGGVQRDPKPSRRRLWLWLLGGVGIFLGLLGALVLMLTIWFPAELVRPELESQLAHLVNGTVRIQALSFNLFSGLTLEKVEIHQAGQPLVRLERLGLDYRLLDLFRQQLTVHEVRLDRAQISIDLTRLPPDLSEQQPPLAGDGSPEMPPPPTMPVIPVTLALDAFVVKQSSLALTVSPGQIVRVHGANVTMAATVTEQDATLTGVVEIGRVQVDWDGRRVQLPCRLEVDVDVDLARQVVTIRTLALESKPAFRIALSGQIHTFLATPELDLSLTDAAIEVHQLMDLLGEFLPSDFQTLNVKGTVRPHMTLTGRLAQAGMEGMIHLEVKGEQLAARVDSAGAVLAPSTVSLTVEDLLVKKTVPESAKMALKLSTPQVLVPPYSVEHLAIALHGDYDRRGVVSGALQVTGQSVFPLGGTDEVVRLPLTLELEGKGDSRTRAITLTRLVAAFGTFLQMTAQGALIPQESDPGTVQAIFQARLIPSVAHLLEQFPDNVPAGLAIRKTSGRDEVTCEVTGVLDATYRPKQVALALDGTLQGLTVRMESPSVQSSLETLQLSMKADYSAKDARLTGTLASAVHVSALTYARALEVAGLALNVQTSFHGSASPQFALSALQARNQLAIHVKDLSYHDRTMRTNLDELILSATTLMDLDHQVYRVRDLRIASGDLFSMGLAGQYQPATRQFEVTLDLPAFSLREAARQISGHVVEGLAKSVPSGRVALSLEAVGRLPDQTDIEQLTIPVDGTARLTFDDVQGALGGYHVTGANGQITISHQARQADKESIVNVATDVTAEALMLPPTHPLKTLSGLQARGKVTIHDFDEVQVQQIRLGVDGAAVTMTGRAAGLKKAARGRMPVVALIPDLFAHLTTRISLNLDRLQNALNVADVHGAGQVHVDLSISKQERGPLAAELRLREDRVSIRYDTIQIKNMNGTVRLHKRLAWGEPPARAPQSSPQASRQVVPTELISQLRAATSQERALTIEAVALEGPEALTLSDITGDISFDQNTLKIHNLAANLIGGGVGGDMVLTVGPESVGLSARIETVQVDFNRLLKQARRIAGDSTVDATLSLEVLLHPETGAIDWSRTTLALFVTHIGPEALDRLLVFLDPQGSNPTLVGARAQVRLANPDQVSVQLARGLLKLRISFREGLLPSLAIPRIPLGRLLQAYTLTATLPNWEDITQVLSLVGATHYWVMKDGTLGVR